MVASLNRRLEHTNVLSSNPIRRLFFFEKVVGVSSSSATQFLAWPARVRSFRHRATALPRVMEFGSKFATFDELEDAVKEYSRQSYVQYYKRECRMVAAAKRKGIRRHINENISVYQVQYHCIKGGRTFKSPSKGDRATR